MSPAPRRLRRRGEYREARSSYWPVYNLRRGLRGKLTTQAQWLASAAPAVRGQQSLARPRAARVRRFRPTADPPARGRRVAWAARRRAARAEVGCPDIAEAARAR